ncbi:hypothetical protein N9311_05250 [Amylibacter sp.]|nr:hypothetical protein [Amylibacter sp.]
MKVLGVAYGHNATVCLAIDGEIKFIQSEERLNRIKNSTGFPHLTIKYIDENICSLNTIDEIVIFQSSIYGYKFLVQTGFKSVQYGGYLDASQEIVSPIKRLRSFDVIWNFENKLRKLLNKFMSPKINLTFTDYIKKSTLSSIPVTFLDHHQSHALSCLPFIDLDNDWLIITLDSAGDFLSGTISVQHNGKMERLLSITHENSIGSFYSAVTKYLGMRPGEHEYKVMGLAPYADEKYCQHLIKSLKEIVSLDKNGKIDFKFSPATLPKHLDRIFKNQRFDNISYAIQTITEELISDLTKFWIERTNIKKVALAGGVFMNVKANLKILKLDLIEKLVVVPSAGDESTAIGAALFPFIQKNIPILPIQHLYLGANFSDEDILKTLTENNVAHTFFDDIETKVGELLAEGQIVARFKGPMEFGARALGNRSILANPSSFRTVDHINKAIKMRDFWMPFCPSILEEDKYEYVQDYVSKADLNYMSIAVEGKAASIDKIVAASHPRDETIRPQFVSRETNPEYHRLISAFKNHTGIGAVLNTSFNLHGEPNVCSPTDALNTYFNSGLKYLAIGSYLLEKPASSN